MVVSVPTVLANLSFGSPDSWKAAFGWPMTWYSYVYLRSKGLGPVHGWDYSAARLVGDLLLCLLMFTAVAFISEWLLHRYRPRMRWSLRTLLVALGIVAVLCGWCAAACSRAREQDALIAWAGDDDVLVERWGPIWLDLLGADPLRRRVVGATLQWYHPGHDELPDALARLRDLQYMDVGGNLLTPGTCAALGDMLQLRTLIIQGPIRNEEAADECLAWAGRQSHLERLRLDMCHGIPVENVAHLRGVAGLKSLVLDRLYCDKDAAHSWLAAVGQLTQLERLCLEGGRRQR